MCLLWQKGKAHGILGEGVLICMSYNLGEWYASIIIDAELADYGPQKGDIVIRPYGMQLWKRIVACFSDMIETSGYQQAYFPLLIPKQFIDEETKQISGLEPRLYEAAKHGNTDQSDVSVIRPTSETVVNYMFAKWIKSYRDLPIKIYQASNILRWEEVTHPFLKGREIQWVEGHTVHAGEEEATREIIHMSNLIYNFFVNFLALPVYRGEEPGLRKFIGSKKTFSFELLLKNGKSLQLGAIYDIGQLFSKMFSVQFQNSQNNLEHAWGTNWGIGFRLVGALALAHGDERGLRIPPLIAPIQIAIIPIFDRSTNQAEIIEYIGSIEKVIKDSKFRSVVSSIDFGTVKKNIVYWEKRGIPLIIMVGEKELKSRCVTILRRDMHVENNSSLISFDSIDDEIKRILDEVQKNLLSDAMAHIQCSRYYPNNEAEFSIGLDEHWCAVDWCGLDDCENNIKNKYGKVLKIELDESSTQCNCIFCGRLASKRMLIAKTY